MAAYCSNKVECTSSSLFNSFPVMQSCGMILPTNVLKSESCSFNLNNLSRTKASKETKQTNQLAASGRLSTPSSRKLQPHLRYVMFFTAWPPGDRGKQPFVGFPKGQKLSGKKYCWWFRKPANLLRLVVYPSIYKVLYIPGGDRWISETSTVWILLGMMVYHAGQ